MTGSYSVKWRLNSTTVEAKSKNRKVSLRGFSAKHNHMALY